MAANFITINSQFRPFSFQEMLQPYQLYGQAYEGAEQGLEALRDKAGELEELKNNAGDREAYLKYKSYSDALKDRISSLTQGGLTPQVRAGLLESRSDYAKNVIPVSKQIEKRNQLIDQQNKLQAQNPALRFDNDYRTVGIDRMLESPQMGYRSVDLDRITNQVGVLAAQLAKSKLSDPKYRRIAGSMLGYTQQEYGWSPEQLASYIASGFGEGAPKELQQIYRNVLGTAGKGWDANTQNEIIDAVNKGMIAGTRQIVNSQPMIDPRDQAALEYAYWDKKRQQMQNDAMDRIAAKNAGKNNRDNSGAPFKTNSSPADVKTEENLKKYSDLYNSLHTGKGGKYNREYFFNEKGKSVNPMKVYEDYHDISDKYKNMLSMYNPNYSDDKSARDYIRKKYGNVRLLTSDQYDALKKLGYNKGNTASGIMRNLYNSVNSQYIESYDQRLDTSDGAYSDLSKRLLPDIAESLDRNNGKNLIEVLDNNNNKTGKTLDKGDLLKKWTKIHKIFVSPRYADKLKMSLEDKDGNLRTILLEPELISGELGNYMKSFSNEMKQMPSHPMKDAYGNVYSKSVSMKNAASDIFQMVFNSINKVESDKDSKAANGSEVPYGLNDTDF